MRFILSFFLSLLITSAFTSFAQVSSGYDSQNNLNSVGQGVVSNTIRPMKAAYEGVKGTPMLMKDFSKGKLIMTNGTIYSPVLVNIDLIENEVLILKKPENQPWLISRKEISRLSIEPKSDSMLFFLPVELPGKESRFCQQLFSNDTLRLYLFQQKKIKKADFSGAYNAGKKYDEIYSEYRFYISLNGNVKLFKPSKKVMVDLLPGREKEITDFMNSKNPDLKNPEELKLFFDILL